jgi:hypothetical protein
MRELICRRFVSYLQNFSETEEGGRDRPKATVPGEWCNVSYHGSIFLVYSWCSFPQEPTLTDVALPGYTRQSPGGSAMTFEEIMDQALAIPQRRGRVAYRMLKRQFNLDDDALDDLKVERIEAQQVAIDEVGTSAGSAGTCPSWPSRRGESRSPAWGACRGAGRDVSSGWGRAIPSRCMR